MSGFLGPLRTVLLSGGVDSACLLALCREADEGNLDALFIDYGQPSAASEARAATAVAAAFGAPLRRASASIGSVDSGEIPGRNALLVHLALATAPPRPTTLMLGIHAGTPYVDCTPQFLDAMRHSVDLHTGGTMQLAAPFMSWLKQDVYSYAAAMSIPIELTHSCEAANTACGECRSCLDRKQLDACH